MCPLTSAIRGCGASGPWHVAIGRSALAFRRAVGIQIPFGGARGRFQSAEAIGGVRGAVALASERLGNEHVARTHSSALGTRRTADRPQ